MSLDLVRHVLDPVAERIQSQCDNHILSSFLTERYPGGVPKKAGIESWFSEQVKEALGDLFVRLCTTGPDLVLRDGDSIVEIELKAAADLNTSDDETTPRGGVKKYWRRDYPLFAGCLFLGDGSDDSRINKLSEGDIELIARRKIHDGERKWVVGFLRACSKKV